MLVREKGPKFGDLRFLCECGDNFTDGGLALQHAFSGHQVVREKFASGRWSFSSRVPIMEYVVERLRARGESVSGFIRRLNERMDAVNKEDEVQEQARAEFLAR